MIHFLPIFEPNLYPKKVILYFSCVYTMILERFSIKYWISNEMLIDMGDFQVARIIFLHIYKDLLPSILSSDSLSYINRSFPRQFMYFVSPFHPQLCKWDCFFGIIRYDVVVVISCSHDASLMYRNGVKPAADMCVR
jgi:hypothetical protein